VGFDITDQLLISFFAFVRYWRKKREREYNGTYAAIYKLQERL
jgi:hypothetical protein